MKVPYNKQLNNYFCGPATLQMVFEYFGKYISQEKLGKILKTSPDTGTNHEALIETATSHGFYCYVNSDSTLHEIKHFLTMGLPVIVNFIEPSNNESHYAVVTGHQGRELIFNDPWNGRAFRLSDIRFVRRWHDAKNIHRRWIMVITKSDLHLGKQFLPKSAS